MAAAAPAVVPTPPAVSAPEILARLDRIDAQLASISAVIGTVPPVAAVPAEPVTEPEPEEIAAAPDPVEAAVAEATTSQWRDEVIYTLAPGEGVEVKLAMAEGQTSRYAWAADGGVVNYDMHGDGAGQKISYEQGRAVPELAGELTAAFTGNHGWFWRNRGEAPVTVTLRTSGDYRKLRAP